MKPKSTLRHFLALAGSSLLAVSYSHAAIRNWDGDTANNLWATAGNWDTAPANSLLTDIVNFNLATYGGNPVWAPTVGTATSINGITIGALNGTMTLTNTAALSIGASGISIANGAGAFTISGSTTLGAAQNWTNNSASLFTFGAVANGANLLTIGGSGNTTASGVIGNGAGGLTKEGLGLLTLNVANTYTGATTVNGGELRWGVADAIAAGALNINDGGTVNMQTFTDSVGAVTVAKGGTITGTTGALTVSSITSNNGGTINTGSGSIITSSTSTLTYNDTIAGSTTFSINRLDIRGATTFNIARGDDLSGVDFDITGEIFSNSNGRSITKSGSGVMRLSGSIASGTSGGLGADGALSIQDGTLIFNKSAAVNAFGGGGLFTIGDGTGLANSAVLRYETSSNQLANNAITINSDGLFELNGLSETTSGALTMNGGSITTGAGTLSLGAATNTIAGAGTVTGNLTLSGAAATNLTLGGTASINGTTTFSGAAGAGITASGSTSIAGTLAFGSNSRTIAVNTGSDTLTITANITGSGALTKNGAGTLRIGDGTTAGSMSSTSALTMGGGTLAILAPTTGSSSQTIASLATTASTGSTIRITPGSSGNTTLTITSATLSTGAGSSVNFDYTAGTTVGSTVGNNYVVWNPTLTGGIIGGAYTVTDSGGTGFATKNGTNIVSLTDSGSAGLPVSTGSATGSYFIGSGYSTVDPATPGSLVQALSGAVAASNVTVNTTGLASGANLALGTNLLTLGAGMVFDGPNAYEISGSGAGGLRASASGGTINLYNANTNTVTISAPIVANGASVLTVAGPGTTILSGVNTYTGATVLNGGTVRFSGTMAASPITINNGAVAQLGTATGLTSSNTITFGAGSTGSLQLLGNNLTIGALSSNATTLGTPVITNNNGGPSVANATLTINSASASSFGGVIQDGTGGGTLALANSGAGTLTLSGVNTYSGGTVINAGIVSVSSDANLGNASGGLTLNGGQLLAGGNNISSARSVTVNGTGSSMRVAKNNNITTSGALNGAGAITFVDNGGSGANSLYNFTSSGSTFTGAMTLQAVSVGVTGLGDTFGNNLIFTGAGTFSLLATGATTGLTFNNRAIELSNSSGTVSNLNTTHSITIGSNLVASGAGAKVLTLSAVAGPTNVFSGNITDGTGGGTVGINKLGAGTWALFGANTYTGTTTIGANNQVGGTLVINTLKNYGEASSLGAAASGDIIFNRQSSINLVYVGSGNTSNRTIQHGPDVSNRNNGSGIYNNGTGALIFNGSTFNTPFVEGGNEGRTTTFNLGGTYSGSANQIGGVIANNGGTSLIAITKNADTSIWQLSGANTYSGGNTISGGTLRGTQTSGTPFGTGAVTINAGILSLAPTGSGSAVSVTGGTVASGTLFTYNAGAALSLARGSQNSLTYTFGGTGATTTRGTNGTLILSTSDIANFGAAGTNLERFIMNGTAPTQVNTLVSGVVIQDRNTSNAGDFAAYDATNGFTKASYTHTNTFTGSTNVSRVEITSATSTGSIASYAIKANATVTNSGTITLGSSTNPAALILNGGSISGGTLAAANANSEFVIYTSGSSSISSAITTSTSGMSVFGPGSLTLSSSNSFTGGLRVNNSTLIVSNDNQLGGANNALTLRGGTLQTSGASLAIGAGARAITLALGQDQTGGTFNVSSGTTTFQNNSASARIISGSGSLTKTGTGILELTGNTANTYTGGTTVSAGKLLVNTGSGSGSGTGTGTVNVGALGTLGGSGTITGAVNITGQISAGNSIETLGTGTLSLLNGSTLVHELDSSVSTALGSDLLKVTGDLNFTGTVNLSLTDLAVTDVAFAVNSIFSLINYTGTWNGGLLTFGTEVLSDEEVFSFGLNTWRISYNDAAGGLNYIGEYAGGTDSFVNLTAVTIIPEPGAALLGGLGMLVLLRRRRTKIG